MCLPKITCCSPLLQCVDARTQCEMLARASYCPLPISPSRSSTSIVDEIIAAGPYACWQCMLGTCLCVALAGSKPAVSCTEAPARADGGSGGLGDRGAAASCSCQHDAQASGCSRSHVIGNVQHEAGLAVA